MLTAAVSDSLNELVCLRREEREDARRAVCCSAVRTMGSEEESTMVDIVGVSLEGGGSMADAAR